jgi:Fis family transcriptional regulator
MNSDDLPACINTKLNRYFSQLCGEQGGNVHKMVMNEVESVVVKHVLDYAKNQSEAAKILGLSRATLKKKIELYHLKKALI